MSDSESQKTQQAIVSSAGIAFMSSIYPYGKEPPRLIAAINDTLTDAPEHTLFGSYGEARKKSDEIRSKPKDSPKYPSAVGEFMVNMPVPLANVIYLVDGDKTLSSAPIPKHVQTDQLEPVKLAPADAIEQILTWVVKRLDAPWEKIWDSQLGSALQWGTPDPNGPAPASDAPSAEEEEAWARVVSQLLLGVDYAGVADYYNMGGVGDAVPPGQSWEQFIYRRLEKESIIPKPYKEPFHESKGKQTIWKTRVHGGHHVKSWIDPAWTPEEDKPEKTHVKEENKDPAVPITAACQHTATLVSLMRGYPLYWMGDVVNNAVGYMASNACRDMAIFGRDYSKHDPGPFGGAKDLVPPVPAGGMWCPAHTAPVVKYVVNPASAESEEDKSHPPAVPGTIFVWDPDWDLDKNVTIYMTWYEVNYKLRPTISKFLSTRSGVGKGNFNSTYLEKNARVPPANEIPDDATIEKRKKEEDATIAAMKSSIAMEEAKGSPSKKKLDTYNNGLKAAQNRKAGLEAGAAKSTKTEHPVPYNRDAQLPGSHINAVLRVSFMKDALQVFDTGLGSGAGVLARSGSEAIVPVNGGGTTCDGYRQPPSAAEAANPGKAIAQEDSNQQLSIGTGKQYAGYGVPPRSPRTPAEQTEFLKDARSVGLIRFALTKRMEALNSDSDILFISTLRMMYGRDKTQRYPISKLLWSLRNTPGFTNIQAWWLVYVPRGLLAKCMWAHSLSAEDAAAAGVPQVMMLEDFKAHFAKPQFQNDLSVLRFFQRYEPDTWPPQKGKPLETAQKRVIDCRMYDERHYMLVEALTNHGSASPAYSGKAHLFTRYRYEEGKTTPQMNGGHYWFKTLKFAAGKLSWDEMFVSPELKKHKEAIAAKLPPFFPEPVLPPDPPAAQKAPQKKA